MVTDIGKTRKRKWSYYSKAKKRGRANKRGTNEKAEDFSRPCFGGVQGFRSVVFRAERNALTDTESLFPDRPQLSAIAGAYKVPLPVKFTNLSLACSHYSPKND